MAIETKSAECIGVEVHSDNGTVRQFRDLNFRALGGTHRIVIFGQRSQESQLGLGMTYAGTPCQIQFGLKIIF